MTEREYVLERFGRSFAPFRGKKLCLYGQGAYTRAIIETYHGEYRFAAVLSDAESAGEYCGVRLAHVDALEREAPDMVILSEHKQTKEPDYERIHDVCEQCGIALYSMYGVDELAAHRELEIHTWQSLAGWRRITRGYDVVTFAALDTFMYWDGADGKPEVRPIFRQLADELVRSGVPVLFLGRNALPREQIAEALVDGGAVASIEQTQDCLYMRSGEDLCFRSIRERFPGKRILHVGSGIANDGIIPRFYDIDTYRMVYSSVVPNRNIAPKRTSRISGEAMRRAAVEAIDRNHIVSFDVFDTLLMRKVLCPEDVFALVERRALALGLPAENFAQHRKTAERQTYCGKLADIYDTLGRITQLPEDALDALMALELDVERSVSLRRDAVAELYEYALRRGKRVVLTSDMYMTEDALAALLRANGIDGWDALIVSCEHGAFKFEGLFAHVKALAADGEGIVHIGDSLDADVRAAEDAGIEAVYIPSALDLARQSGWGAAIDAAESLAERCLVGLSVAGAFGNPFQPGSLSDMTEAQRLTRFGYAAAPVFMGFLTWMASQTAGKGYDGILFTSRDAWLLSEFYPRLRKAAGQPLPEGQYFYTSRHAAFLTSASDRAGQSYVSSFAPSMDNRLFLQNVFGIRREELLPPAEGESQMAYMGRHHVLIDEIERRQRAAQLRYFANCGLRKNGRYALVDFVSQGSTQEFLARFAPFALHGLYFARPPYMAQPSEDIDYYFDAEESAFQRNFMEMEGVMTSPEPSVLSFSDDGRPVFAREVRPEERLRQMQLAQGVIREYLNDYFDLFYFPGDGIRSVVPEEIYAADGYHWVFEWMYDDWVQARISD